MGACIRLPYPTMISPKKYSWGCPKPVHQLILNELDAFTWEKANKKTIWTHTAVRGRFSSCWIHPGHCRSSYHLLPLMGWNCPRRRWGMQMPNCWASLVLPGPGSTSTTLHDLKKRWDGSDHHISPQSIPVPLHRWPWSCFPPLLLSQRQPFRSHVWEVSASGWEPLGFFTPLSICLSSQALDKRTNYCGASHHSM